MENAVEALEMAGSVLLFVLGLSIVVLAFSQVVGTIDTMVQYNDREFFMIEGDSRFYYLPRTEGPNNEIVTNRYVGKETIIPAIYRAVRENYKIVFENFPDNYHLYKNKDNVEVNSIDLQDKTLGKNLDNEFLDGIVFGKFDNNDKTKFQEDFEVILNSYSLFQFLTDNENKKIKESLGTYYMEELSSGDTTIGGDDPTAGKQPVHESNKTEKRVITYTFE